MTKTSNEHDFTNPYWGHNIDITKWDSEKKTGRAVCWVTPGLKNGDIVIVKSRLGSMRLVVSEVEWVTNVDDMYRFAINPAQPIPETEAESWVTKVKRSGGGTSILDAASTKEKAQALADEFNAQFQTDAYFIEPYNEAVHAYSRHGK